MADGWKVVHMKIVITAPFAAQQVEELKGQHEVLFSPQDDSTPLRSEEQLHSLLAEERAEIFITESDRVTAQVLEGLDDLKLLCVCRTGLTFPPVRITAWRWLMRRDAMPPLWRIW